MQARGVGFYFKKNLKFNILHEKSIFEDRIFEFIFAEVWIKNNKKIIVGNIYRPSVNHPTLTSSEQYQQFMELLTNLLSSFSELNQQIFLFCDFNLDALKYNIIGNVTEYIDMLFSYGFLQIVMKSTRCTQHSASLIDHILTNSKSDIFQTAILTTKILDHFPLIFMLKDNVKYNNNKIIKYRDFSKSNVQKFSASLRSINWDFVECK